MGYFPFFGAFGFFAATDFDFGTSALDSGPWTLDSEAGGAGSGTAPSAPFSVTMIVLSGAGADSDFFFASSSVFSPPVIEWAIFCRRFLRSSAFSFPFFSRLQASATSSM
jgi:hypothetical protein